VVGVRKLYPNFDSRTCESQHADVHTMMIHRSRDERFFALYLIMIIQR